MPTRINWYIRRRGPSRCSKCSDVCADRDSKTLSFCSKWIDEEGGLEVTGSDVVNSRLENEAEELIDRAASRAWDANKKPLPNFVKAFGGFKAPDDWGVASVEQITEG